jgi:NAD(P) transhydrogenase
MPFPLHLPSSPAAASGNPTAAGSFDLVVIGSGPAGVEGAKVAATFGAKVCVVERNPDVGGAAVNTGTLPSKTLRETALAISGHRMRQLHGVDLALRRPIGEIGVPELMRHERHVARTERGHITDLLGGFGIQLILGDARLVDPHTVAVRHAEGAERLLRAGRILIACGSAPQRPAPFDFARAGVFDSDSILHLPSLPRSIAVVGGGVIGSEYACVFQALGCRVHLVDRRAGLLPFLDRDVSATLTRAMESAGVTFHWNTGVAACTHTDAGGADLKLDNGQTLPVDAVLVAAGRVPVTDHLNLDAAGVACDDKGRVAVNERYQTSAPHVYATGDVIGFPALASMGMQQSRVAMTHAFAPSSACGSWRVAPLLPYGIYTVPECAMVGEPEQVLIDNGTPYVAGVARYTDTGRGVIIGEQFGFLKLLFHAETRQLLGVHAIGENATDLIHTGLMVMLLDGGIDALVRACFNYPTLGDLYKVAASNAMMQFNRRELAASRQAA